MERDVGSHANVASSELQAAGQAQSTAEENTTYSSHVWLGGILRQATVGTIGSDSDSDRW